MRPKTILQTLSDLYPARRNVCLEGAPGGGKTSVVRQFAQSIDKPYLEIHLPTAQPEDFGIPWPTAESDTFCFKRPDWFPVKGKAPDGGILCFDDRNAADNSLQKVLANILQARVLNGHEMADWMIVSTGNDQSHRAGANRVLSHLRDRETLIKYETHLDDYCAYAASAGIPAECVNFLRYRPGLLHDFDPTKDICPTPRSWTEGVFSLVGKVSKEAEYEVYAGAVGEGAAAEFTGYMRIFRNLPNPDTILSNPKTADVPTDPATLYALTGSLANIMTPRKMANFVTYLDRLQQDFSVLAMTLAIRANPDESLDATEEFIEWSVKHQDVLF